MDPPLEGHVYAAKYDNNFDPFLALQKGRFRFVFSKKGLQKQARALIAKNWPYIRGVRGG